VLVTGGNTSNDEVLASAEIYDPLSRTWSLASPMSSVRVAHTATLLANGRVLVSGGTSGYSLASAELYDPVAGTWSLTGDMSVSRFGHTATLLPGGRVLVAGGHDGWGELWTAEIYDPALATWSATGTLNQGRAHHTATVVAGGRVLVTGGAFTSYLDGNYYAAGIASAETYDPAVATWSPAGAMSTGRYDHTATLLPDGRVLMTGGEYLILVNGDYGDEYYTTSTATAEIYDPAGRAWSLTGSMRVDRHAHTATLLLNGRVLISGGASDRWWDPGLAGAELYDSALGSWSGASSMSTSRSGHSASLVAGGNVLVVGAGTGVASAEIYDPSATPAPDVSGPQVTCGTADGAWHRGDVAIACTASDPDSGLVNEGEATFSLVTNVPDLTETDNAMTGTRQVCNTHIGCTTAGPIAGNRVDNKPPSISISSPAAGATYKENASATASYACVDGGVGLAACLGPAANGGLIDTSSTGTKTFSVASVDALEHYFQREVKYTVVSSGADVGIALSAPTRVASGAMMTYAMVVTNAGTGGATGVVVSNALPVGVVFASASTSQGTVSPPAIGSTGTLSATLGSIGLGGTATVTVVVKITAKAGTTLTDTATVTATTADSNSSNNSMTRKTSVNGSNK
jgi:uncharacterized repeat protein (TIGR01451 family)